jgi:hypothetical protein
VCSPARCQQTLCQQGKGRADLLRPRGKRRTVAARVRNRHIRHAVSAHLRTEIFRVQTTEPQLPAGNRTHEGSPRRQKRGATATARPRKPGDRFGWHRHRTCIARSDTRLSKFPGWSPASVDRQAGFGRRAGCCHRVRERVMHPSLSRALTVLVSLLLALPPGWCCLTPGPRGGEAPAQEPCSCCHAGRKAPPGRAPAHCPGRAPAQRRGCVCPDLASAMPEQTRSLHTAPALPVDAAPLAAGSMSDKPLATAPVGQHVPAPPRQLLHCLWLC